MNGCNENGTIVERTQEPEGMYLNNSPQNLLMASNFQPQSPMLHPNSFNSMQQSDSLSKSPSYAESNEDYPEKEALGVHMSNPSTLQMIQEEQNEMAMVSSTSSSLSSSASTTPRMSIASTNNAHHRTYMFFEHEMNPMLAMLKRTSDRKSPVFKPQQQQSFKSEENEAGFSSEPK